jgi:hypothetical protein
MKRTVILLTGFLLVAIVLQAQQKQSRFLTDLSFGPSFPVGKFGDKSYSTLLNSKKPAGLAKTGVSAQLSVGYYLTKSVGVLLSSGYSENKQDWSGYDEYLKTSIYDGPPRTETDGKSWKTVNVMGGGFFVLPLTANRNLNVLTKLTAGIVKTAVPAHDFKAYTLDDRLLWEGTTDKEDLPWTFCYQVSVGLQYKLSNHLHVLLDINSFNATAQKTVPGSYATSGTRNYNLSTVNAMAGIGLNF